MGRAVERGRLARTAPRQLRARSDLTATALRTSSVVTWLSAFRSRAIVALSDKAARSSSSSSGLMRTASGRHCGSPTTRSCWCSTRSTKSERWSLTLRRDTRWSNVVGGTQNRPSRREDRERFERDRARTARCGAISQGWFSQHHSEQGKQRAGDGNRTRMTSLEGWDSAIELRPRTRQGYPPSRAVDRDVCSPTAFRWRWSAVARESGRGDLNPRPPAPKAGALPGCATPRVMSPNGEPPP
jgi:hypothetical protein